MRDKIDKFRGSITQREREGSYLADETFLMEQERRSQEQQGHRQLAKVHVVEHEESRPAPGGGPGVQANAKDHPWLASQPYAGISPNESPLPSEDPLAAIDFENAQREQQLELVKRLNPNYAPGTAPTPKP